MLLKAAPEGGRDGRQKAEGVGKGQRCGLLDTFCFKGERGWRDGRRTRENLRQHAPGRRTEQHGLLPDGVSLGRCPARTSAPLPAPSCQEGEMARKVLGRLRGPSPPRTMPKQRTGSHQAKSGPRLPREMMVSARGQRESLPSWHRPRRKVTSPSSKRADSIRLATG